MPCMVAARRQRRHRIGQRETFADRAVDRGVEIERRDQPPEHRPVHALGIAAAHLVPIVSRELELDPIGQLDLRVGRQIVEARFAGGFLLQIPAHRRQVGFASEPVEQRVVLSGPGALEAFEPVGKPVHVGGSAGRRVAHFLAQVAKEVVLELEHLAFGIQPAPPIVVGQARFEARMVPARKPPLRLVAKEVRRASRLGPLEQGRHDQPKNPLFGCMFPASSSTVRVLGITETCDLGSLYRRLLANGHDVRVSVSEPLAQGTMAGLVPRTADWRGELDWVKDGIILFEAVGFGALQDELRTQGFNVVGGSAFGDRLENDRAAALGLLAKRGLNIAGVDEFDSAAAATADLAKRPRRCVFKRSASAGDTFVGTFADGRDVAALLAAQPPDAGEKFVLMDHVDGVETGVGAYFNGERFLRPACLDWEHKRFFPGDIGELTGEMGTVATFEGSEAIFAATLQPLEPLLRDAGHVGYVNLNMIINADGIWPLEFTCRFGYPGFAVLEPLQAISWGELFETMIDPGAERFATHSGFCVAVVLTTPPLPYSRHEVEAPVSLPLMVDDFDDPHLHLGEVGLADDQLVTSGVYGWSAVVTGTGATITEAQAAANARAARVVAPNVRYRTDIGTALSAGSLEKLGEWGCLKLEPSSRIASQIVR